MFRVAIVGSTSLAGNASARQVIRAVLDQYGAAHSDLVVVSGGARGIDQMAIQKARALNVPVVEHLPAGKGWPFYRARNLRIAADCDCLVRIVDASSQTYGSGWTRDRAHDLGALTYEYVVEHGTDCHDAWGLATDPCQPPTPSTSATSWSTS